MNRVTLKLTGTIERIPDTEPEFTDWCKEKGINALNGGRRGWWSALGTYLRDAEYVWTSDFGDRILLTEQEYKDKVVKVTTYGDGDTINQRS